MPCYTPLTGYRSTSGGITFSKKQAWSDLPPLEIPCGQCVGCRLERSRQWALRCVHEASLHDDNCFITLTYDDDHLPPGGTLVKKHFQDFMKRLRKDVQPTRIRYYACGEYGDRTFRPHYHALLFNYRPSDLVLIGKGPTEDRHPYYGSESLAQTWGYGHVTVGECTFESAAYCARYVMKKQTGRAAADHYGDRLPEFNLMSRRPGIGKDWYNQFKSDLYPHDFTVLNNKKMRPPKVYDTYYEQDGGDIEALKTKRRAQGRLHSENNTKERLAVREEIQERKLKQLQRQI